MPFFKHACRIGWVGLTMHRTRQRKGAIMLVKFVLVMEDLVVENQLIDCLVLEWTSVVDQEEVMDLSHRWITTQNFLTRRMVGLQRVGESSLSIEPLEDIPDFRIPL